METSIKAPIQWAATNQNTQTNTGIYARFINFTETQTGNKTAWFLFSLIFQGVFFLPLPAALIYGYNAPVFIIGITLFLFFANVIAGMGGATVKTIIQFLTASFIIHLLMAIICILA